MRFLKTLDHLLRAPGLPGHLLALLAGGLACLAFAPWQVWPLGLLSIGLWLRGLLDLNPAQAALRGWWYGFGLFGVGTSWIYYSIHDYGYAPPWLAGGLMLIFCASMSALFCVWPAWASVRLFQRQPRALWLGGAALWVMGEWVSSWLLTGFPWLPLGYAHVDTWLAGWAPLGGVFSISLIVALSGGFIALFDQFNQTTRLVAVLVLPEFWLGGWLLRDVAWTTPQGEPVKVAMVQGNVPQSTKWDPQTLPNTLMLYTEMSQELWGTPLVIWPEAALPATYHRIKGFVDKADARAKESGTTLITGIPYWEAVPDQEQGRFLNGVIAVGQGSGWYFKRRLVPFGEYVPLESWLRGLIAFFDLPMSAFSRGEESQANLQAGPLNIATYICYEVVYPDLLTVTPGNTDVLLTVSNDTWFGDSIGPLQHFDIARMRAVEARRYLLRDTNNGITAIVDHQGRVLSRLPQFTRDVLKGEVQARRGSTPFMLTGSFPLLLICGALVAFNRRGRSA